MIVAMKRQHKKTVDLDSKGLDIAQPTKKQHMRIIVFTLQPKYTKYALHELIGILVNY